MVVIPVQPEQTEMFWYILGFNPQILGNCFKIWKAGSGVFSFRPVLTEQCLQEVHQEMNIVGMLHGMCFAAGESLSTLYA